MHSPEAALQTIYDINGTDDIRKMKYVIDFDKIIFDF